MSVFEINDFLSDIEDGESDRKKVKKLVNIRKEISRDIFDNFSRKISPSLLWEVVISLPKNLDKEKLEVFKKYFVVSDWKIWPRWWSYYFLFWDFYRKEWKGINRETLDSIVDSFLKELFQFLEDFEKILNTEWLEYLILDNLRNMILYLLNFYMLVYQNTKFKRVYKIPFTFNLKDIGEENIIYRIQGLKNLYFKVVDYIFMYFFYNWQVEDKIKNEELKIIFRKIKREFEYLYKKSIFIHKGKRWTFFDVYKTLSLVHQFFKYLNRNIREEDNLFVIFVSLLQKDIFLFKKIFKTFIKYEDVQQIVKKKIKKSYSDKLIGAILYGWIEYWILAEYLWLDVVYIYYSKYNLNQKDKIYDLNRLVVNSNVKDLNRVAREKICLLFDDNTQTGNTLSDIRTFLSINWITTIPIVWRHVLLSKKKPYYFEWEKLKDWVWDSNILIETLIRAYSWYFRWNRQLFIPFERKKRQILRNFGRFIKD